MKNFLTISISCILIVSLIGCNGKKFDKYESLVFDISNDGILTKTDVEYWTGEYFEEKGISNKTIEFDGIRYTGKYRNSITERNNSYTTHYFRTDDGMRFGIRGDTEQLVAFTTMNNEFFDTEPYLDDVENSAQVASDIADNIARQYLDDINSYTLEEESVVKEAERDGKNYIYTYYRFEYIKMINGYETSDRLYISVTSKGHIAAFNMGDVGAFDDIEISFDESKVNESVIQKVNEIYESTGYTLLEKEIVYKKLTVTPDGQVCIVSILDITLQESDKKVYGTKVRILTIL